MINTIKNLQNQVKHIKMTYSQGYDKGPIIGMRGIDGIWTDDICWLIAGDMTSNGRILKTVSQVDNADINSLSVSLSAQATVHGSIVQVHLGYHKVVDRTPVDNDKGIVTLD